MYCVVYTFEAEAFKFKDSNISTLLVIHIPILNAKSNASYNVEPSTL